MFHLRLKQAGLLTKLIVLGLIIYMATSLLDLRGQIQESEIVRDQLQASISAMSLENQRMTEAIEHSDDPAVMEQAARDEGYVKEGETLYVDIAG